MSLPTYPVFHEELNLGDLVKYEGDNLYSRDLVIVAPGQNLVLGQVVGELTASGQIVALQPAASDGSQITIGICIRPITTGENPNPDGLILARHAAVADGALVWPPDITPEQQAAAVQQLRALGVLIRQEV